MSLYRLIYNYIRANKMINYTYVVVFFDKATFAEIGQDGITSSADYDDDSGIMSDAFDALRDDGFKIINDLPIDIGELFNFKHAGALASIDTYAVVTKLRDPI